MMCCSFHQVDVGKVTAASPHISSSSSTYSSVLCVCVCVFFLYIHTYILDIKFVERTPAGVTQEEGHTGFLIHLLSAVHALIFFARRIQPFLSLVDREVEFCVLTI